MRVTSTAGPLPARGSRRPATNVRTPTLMSTADTHPSAVLGVGPTIRIVTALRGSAVLIDQLEQILGCRGDLVVIVLGGTAFQ